VLDVLDFEALIKDELLTLGFVFKPDWMSDALFDLYTGIIGHYPNAVFQSITEFERTVCVYFKRELNDELYDREGTLWAMGISKNILLRVFTPPSKPENSGVSIGKIKWVIA